MQATATTLMLNGKVDEKVEAETCRYKFQEVMSTNAMEFCQSGKQHTQVVLILIAGITTISKVQNDEQTTRIDSEFIV